MKIAVISRYCPPVDYIGSGVQSWLLANAYAALGHDVTFHTVAAVQSTQSVRIKRHKVTDKLRLVGFALSLNREDFSQYDLVHAGGDDHLLRIGHGTTWIRTFHGASLRECVASSSMKLRIRTALLALNESISAARCHVPVAVSRDTARYFSKKMLVIPNGVDTAIFRPVSPKTDYESVLFVGVVNSRKRGYLVIDACSALQRKFPRLKLQIVRDQENYEQDFISSNGYVSQTKLVELYSSSWCTVLPSSYEGFGLPYIESMACGTPPIATPNPGALETVKLSSGMICSPSQIVETIDEFLSNIDLRKNLSSNCLNDVQQYDLHEVAKHYLSLVA